MTNESIAAGGGLRKDLEVLSLVGVAHFFAHFYVIVLPPLFPVLAGEFGVSYAALGMLLTVMSLSNSLVQVPVGFLVDRLGARPILVIGLLLMSGGVLLIGIVERYWLILPLMVLIGFGNSAFHPANYSIMSRRISPRRMGRAFSLHTFAGHLGWAVAPGLVVGLASLSSWRMALMSVGLVGLGAALFIWLKGRRLALPPPAPESGGPKSGAAPSGAPARSTGLLAALAFFASRTMFFLFLFMVLSALATSGLNGFVVTALVDLYDVPLTTASFGLTVFLITGAAGVLLGGQLADWTRRQDLILAVGLIGGSLALMAVGGLPLGFAVALGAIGLAGLSLGAIRPSRDLMVRRSAPTGGEGKVFGFVTMGMNLGGAISPVLFGWLIDRGATSWIFFIAALSMSAALAAAILVGRQRDDPAGG